MSLAISAINGSLRSLITTGKTGTSGANTIIGGGSADTIKGGGGADILTGGQGADRFVFASLVDSAPSARDLITDFVPGTDIIDLSASDANTSTKGNQAFFMAVRTQTLLPRA
jgi:Ca2+-binding RTX toxin-like protein